MKLCWVLVAFLLLANRDLSAEPIDCATMPVSLQGVEDAACTKETQFEFDAFRANSHNKRFSGQSSAIPGGEARGVIYELRGAGPEGATLYAALARADDVTHIRFVTDLEAWAASGWLPWRRGADSDWSATGVVKTAAGKWYFARFTLEDQRCLVIQRYHALHENGFRFAVIAATCAAGATYGEAEAARLADSVRINQRLVN